ncbi:heavy metal translocating P-type ATPase [Thermotoga caldifontis]|uniref:heavy metal translocating P-type ATPase n=1 Tax=Thermotoga caldifontis TaxID=1508419 RepID=UPI0006939F4B|nr:heavy metal translocating P-type ATPase [Thermotoga caldifontis]
MDNCSVCHVHHEEEEHHFRDLVLLIASGVILLVSVFAKTPWLAVVAYLLSGWEVLKRALVNFSKSRFFDENSLMSVASVGAIVLKEFPEAATVMVLYRMGELIEHYVFERSNREMKRLLSESPRYAWKIEQGTIKKVRVEELKPGDIVLVRPGEKVPSDGVLVEGTAQINVSHLTGEHLPQSVFEGEKVFAGSIVESGTVKVQILKEYSESSMAKVTELVQKAQERKAKAERFVTKFARYYTPAVVVSAIALTVVLFLFARLSFSESLYRSLVLLVISCPCALALSVPLTYVAALAKASRRGIFVKGAQYFDTIASAKNVVFDKTGTLTETDPKLVRVEPHNGFSKDEVLFFAAHAGLGSNHPLSRALSGELRVSAEFLKEAREFPGLGVRAIVRDRLVHLGNDRFLHEENIDHPESVCRSDAKMVNLCIDRKYAGTLVFKERLKETAQEAVSKLKKAGLKVYVMSGDRKGAVRDVAEELKHVEYFAELKPEDKLTLLEERIMKDGTTVFVGDGINDAPALSRSDVGVAMNSLGNDAVMEIADVVLMNAEPIQVWQLFSISRKTRSIVVQNIVFAIGTKVLFILLAATGKATMWQGVFADTGVMVLCALNSLRLFFDRFKRPVSKSGTVTADSF